jgi:hypothetical protein
MVRLHAKDDVPTLLGLGALVSIVASLAHEALGHGVGCLLDRGHITLITFLVFRCAGAGVMADGGGPIGVVVIGCLALAVSVALKYRPVTFRLFLFNLGAIALFWVCGQAIDEAFNGTDDWGHVATDLNWSSQWHLVVGAIGVIGYGVTLRVSSKWGETLAGGRPMRLLLPYIAATLSAIVLGALWHGDRFGSALDGFLSFGIAPIGYLLVIKRVGQRNVVTDSVGRNPAFLLFVAIAWLSFALTVAEGMGRLS